MLPLCCVHAARSDQLAHGELFRHPARSPRRFALGGPATERDHQPRRYCSFALACRRRGASELSADRTVFLETPYTRAISEIDICSARCNRVSAQSSTLNTHFLPGSVKAKLSAQVVSFRMPRPVQFSAAVDTARGMRVSRASTDGLGRIAGRDAGSSFLPYT